MLQVLSIFVKLQACTCETKVHSLKDKMTEFAKRGDVCTTAFSIAKALKEGKLKEKAGLMNNLDMIKKNLCKKKKRKRYSATTKDFYEVFLMMGGPRLCDVVSQNPDGPHVHSAICVGRSQAKH